MAEAKEQLPNATKHELASIIQKNAVAYVGWLILESTRPPNMMSQPLAAPGGGTNMDWLVVKHSLRCWTPEIIQTCETIDTHFRELCAQRGAIFRGVVGQPLYSCTRMKWFHEDGQPLAASDRVLSPQEEEHIVGLPCGRRAQMTPLLQLKTTPDCKWLCKECATEEEQHVSKAGSPLSRIFSVWPLIECSSPWQGTFIGQGTTVMRVRAVEFICEAPPHDWQWPSKPQMTNFSQMNVTKMMHCTSQRFIFKGFESEKLWASSQAYGPTVS